MTSLLAALPAWWRSLNWNWPLLLPLLITTAVAIAGWYVADGLTAARDRSNKQREIRVQYLIEAYRRLALASQRPPQSSYFRDMEAAVADIQLFGSPSQVREVTAFLDEFQKNGKASLDPLLLDLRNDLRVELQLSVQDGPVRWFRPEGGQETTVRSSDRKDGMAGSQ
jgi:hypothetical protein